jgi:two-component system chemotaxis sensor kinase CheA
MVTARATLQSVAADIDAHLPQELSLRLSEAQSLLARVLQDLQRSAMRMRMAPAERVLRRFTRVVRDLARASGKRARLRTFGQATELDRGLLDALEDPLLHLVRNAVDHGLETPAERAARGKPEEGTLTLRASREGNQVLIEVADDGRGIDPAAVLEAARARGVLGPDEGDELGDAERLQLVFRPGLSTARTVTETSGRGVGLDVVRSTVEALRGSVHASNLESGGAAFVIRVPLTVAILRALLFRVGAQTLALPLSSVLEIARASDLLVQRVGGRSLFRLRDETLGLVELCELLREPEGPPGGGFVLVLRGAGGAFGVRVDALQGEQELVIKAVQDRFIRAPLVAGAAVLGGGVPVLILDALALQRAAQARAEAGGA